MGQAARIFLLGASRIPTLALVAASSCLPIAEKRGDVSLAVFNTLGQQVATLVDGTQDAGSHEVRFDGNNLATGVYFYRIQAGAFVEVKKFVLVR